MTDDQAAPAPTPTFPRDDLPVTFADGILSAAWGGGAAKLYLFRSDPNTLGTGGSNQVVVGQIVMPVLALASASAFLDKCVKKMIADNYLTQDEYENMKAGI